MKTFICQNCGHEQKSDNKWGVRCNACHIIIYSVKMVCQECSKEYIGFIRSPKILCPDCIEKERKEKVAALAIKDKTSPYKQLIDNLCAISPDEVHQYIRKEAACRENLARKIASEAKTAEEAQNMIKQADYEYIHSNKQSFGVTQYGGF